MAEQDGCCAVIVAAGNSTRMGRPKQFLPLLGKPALWWTLRAFDRAARVSSLVLVVREEDRPQAEALARRASLSKPALAFAPGGAERQLSVRSGLLAAPGMPALAAVHDGARPLVTPQEIDAVVARSRAPGRGGPGRAREGYH